MPTQGERQDFLWRPNDESSTTRARYDAEAEHWYRSFKSAERKQASAPIGETFGVIGLVLSLTLNLMLLIVLLLSDLLKYLRKRID
ncbi:hypothetical protein [Patiriisocius sp. Uisw_017]|uniref:hypothetical protein n=1 Tax=Patiriisocius sp. Uisw_017 TaxID=3230968 RepID=UPI0039E9F5CB